MSYNNGGYNNYRREHRINEDDVPESKHTIFIRGLPGSMSTDEIKDYFEDKIGPVSFDFVKTSPDNARLFIAVRFETREDAKSAMTMFSSRDILNHRCDLSWFKDIRRFAQYQQSMGVPFRGGRGRGGFRGRGSYRGGGYGNRDYDRDHRRRDSDRDRDRSSRSRSKSRSRSPRSRSHSRSSKRSSSRDRSRSRSSVDRSRSRSLRRSRSRSAKRSDNESRSRRRSTSRDSAASVESKESRKRRNKKKRSEEPENVENKEQRRSRRSPSHSAVSSDEGEIHSDADRKNRSGNIPSDPKDRSGSAMDMSSRENSPIPPPAPIPPPTVTPTIKVNLKTTREDLEIPVPPPAPVPPVAAPMVDVQKTSFSIGMDTDEPKIVKKTESLEQVICPAEPPRQPPPGPPPVPASEKRTNLPPPPHPPAMVSSETSLVGSRFRPAAMSFEGEPICKKERLEETPTPQTSDYAMRSNPYNSWTPVEKQNVSNANGFGYNQPAAPYAPKDDSARFPVLSKTFSDIHEFQQQLIRGVKAEPKEESFGLTLSSLSTEEDDEMRKKQAREQRLAAMDEMEQERFYIQKRKLENAFKNDCNTYAIVIRKLLTKDSSLERPLRMALIETMEDLEKQMMEKIDNFLQIY